MHFNSKPYLFYQNDHEVKYFKKYVSLTAHEGGGGREAGLRDKRFRFQPINS